MIRSAFLAALDNAAMLTGKIAALLLFTWIIGPEAQGAFTLFLTTHVLIVVAASLGFGTANNYFLAKARSTRLRAAYLGNTLLVSLLAGGLSTAAFYFIGNSIGVFSALSETLLQLLLLSLVPGVLNALTGSFLFGRNRFGVHLTGTCIHNTVFLAGLATEAIAGTLSAETGMGWWTLGLFLSTLFWLIAAWREIDGLPFLHLQTLKRQTRYALKAYPYFVMSAANYRLDNFIVAGFLDLSALGVYSIAVASVEVFLYVSRSLSTQRSHIRRPIATRPPRTFSSHSPADWFCCCLPRFPHRQLVFSLYSGLSSPPLPSQLFYCCPEFTRWPLPPSAPTPFLRVRKMPRCPSPQASAWR